MRITLGAERERFIVNKSTGKITPAIGTLLPKVQRMCRQRRTPISLFGHELFAGQVEDRTLPCSTLQELRAALIKNDVLLEETIAGDSLLFDFSEIVAESDVEKLEVNPFDERHLHIWSSISKERQSAASRVTAVHIHLSVGRAQAVALLNACRREQVENLIKLGDHSSGARIRTYREMAQTDGFPPFFSNFAELTAYIQGHGGEKNVWDLVRYKPSTQTVEFRMFGATPDINEIIGYARACLSLFSTII